MGVHESDYAHRLNRTPMEPLLSTLASCISVLSALLGLVEKLKRVLGRKRKQCKKD